MHEFQQKCRLCLQRFRRGKRMSISDECFQRQLRVAFHFEVLPDEGYPNEVCRSCTIIINDFVKYSDKVHSNQQSLKSDRLLCSNVATCVRSLLSSKNETSNKNSFNGPMAPEHSFLNEEMHFEEIELNHSSPPSPEEQQDEGEFHIEKEKMPFEEIEETHYSPSTPQELETDNLSERSIIKKVEDDPKLIAGTQKFKPVKTAPYSEADDRLRDSFHLGCDLCSFVSLTFRELNIHYQKEHNTTGYVRCCGRKFRRRARALEHVDAHKGTILCNICHKTFTTYFALKVHILNRHSDPKVKKYKCDHCDQTFVMLGTLKQHQSVHTKLRCKICDKSLSTANSLKAHMEKKHGTQTKLICATCGKEFFTKAALDRHMNNHMGIETYEKVQCKLCQKWLHGRRSLKIHVQRMHEEAGPSQCDICQHVSPNIHSLKHHKKRMHLRGKPFECNLCRKQFRTKLNLREHVATHTGIPLYECEICSVTFKSNANRYSHIKSRHPHEWKEQQELKSMQKAGKIQNSSSITS